MQSRPPYGTNNSKPIGLIRKILFGLSCLVCFICICALLSFKHKDSTAMNGELVASSLSQSPFVSNSNETFLGLVFDYFGNVTYLFPLVLVFLSYKLFMKRVHIKEVDFFVIGTLILGFNLLVIGLCALFSVLFSGAEIGAGGILGDFFNIFIFKMVPRPLATILPVIVTFVGLILFTARSPLWYCDKIGESIGNLAARVAGRKQVSSSDNGSEKASVQEKAADTGNSNVRDYENNTSKIKAGGNTATSDLNTMAGVSGRAEPSFGNDNAPDFTKNKPSFINSTVPPFAGRSSFPAFGASEEGEDLALSRHHKERKLSFRSARTESHHERIEPQFGSMTASAQPSFSSSAAMQPSARSDGYVRDNVQESADGPSTYITGASFLNSSENTATARDYNSYQNETDDTQSSTIINGSAFDNRAQAHKDDNEKVTTTIISRFDPSAAQQNTEKNSETAASAYANTSDSGENSKSSTIIYKAGADHLPPTEMVGSPSRKSEVSTVITRTTTVPVNNLNSGVNVTSKSDNSLKGQFSESPRSEEGRVLADDDRAYENAETSSMFPTQEELEENVIDFNDLTKNEVPKLNGSQIKISSLSSSFVPSEDDSGKLKQDTVAPIKESDESFEQYSRGTRGVNAATAHNSPANTSAQAAVEERVENKESVKDSAIYEDKADALEEHENYSGSSDSESKTQRDSLNSEEQPQSGTFKAEQENNGESSQEAAQSLLEESSLHRDDDAPLPSSFAGVNVPSQNDHENDGGRAVEKTGYVSQDDGMSFEDSQENPQDSYGQNSGRIPFEDMNSINGSVPYGLKVEPRRNPITSMPTVSYAVATETTPKREYDNWRPPLNLLTRSNQETFNNDEEILRKIDTINLSMKNFNARARVANYVIGPVITRFDLELEPGVKSSSIMNLSIDLQRQLMTNKINMLPSIIGTPYMGIEVPNDHRQLITLGDIVETDEFLNSNAYLPMCVGVNTVGKTVVADLATAPHLLIAGTTGSGKSAGLNSMLVSLLLARSPAELRLIMIDPKTVEFTKYVGLPHLLTPIITDPESTTAALGWLIKEQERRYRLLSLMRVSNIQQLNALIRSENAKGNQVYDPIWTADMGGEPPVLKPLPYILLVIDEFADLMAVASSGKKGGQKPEALIGRLAAKARAAGIHLILATQTPRADIVTGSIRANMPSRIAYTVQNSQESRIILDESGAENLLGNGDMMVKYQKLNNSQLFRAHGPYTSDDDVHNVVQSWIDRAGDPEYVEGVTEFIDEEEAEEAVNGNEDSQGALDAKFDSIVEWIRTTFSAMSKPLSISEIQTTHSVGYNRAKRIHRQLQAEGIIDNKGNVL